MYNYNIVILPHHLMVERSVNTRDLRTIPTLRCDELPRSDPIFSSKIYHIPSPISFFFLNDPAPPETYPLPLPDALPISLPPRAGGARGAEPPARSGRHDEQERRPSAGPRRGEPSRNLVRRVQADRLRRGIVLVLRAEHRRHGDRGAPVRPPAESLHAQRAGARARQAVRPDEVQRWVPQRAAAGPGRDADPVERIQSGCAG